MNLRILGSLVAVFLVAGCAADNTPVLIGNVRPLDLASGCFAITDNDVYLPTGRLDVAGGGQYFAIAELISQLGGVAGPGSETGSTEISSDANSVILDTIDLDYSSTPDLSLQDQTLPYYGVFSPGSRDNQVAIPFVPGAIAEQLQTALVSGDRVTLLVGAQFSGRTRSGTPVTTNRIEFPIELYHSGTTCTDYAQNSPCGGVGGMESIPVECAMATP